MKRALAKLRTEPRQRDRLVKMLLDVAANGFHCLHLDIAAGCSRAAAQAGAITGAFGFIRPVEKRDVLPPRPPRGARRPAVHAGRRHGEHKAAVAAGVAGQDCLPIAGWVALSHLGCQIHIEYRTGCHNDESVGWRVFVGHPVLAVKAILLARAGEAMLKCLFSVLLVSVAAALWAMTYQDSSAGIGAEIVAAHVDREITLDAAHPAAEWRAATPVTFFSDWQGKNPDPRRETKVRVLWSSQNLYLRFECRYRELYVFEDSEPNGRRDHLWDRDVAEVFLQPDPSRERFYKEFEVSSNGMWIDLDISPGGLADLKSGMRRSVVLDERAHTWNAELAIPLTALTANFDASALWRINFYRIEGRQEPRAYLAWRPTHTPQPDFHVPQAFGRLRFGVERSNMFSF
jgi:hypothetical protein